MASFPSKKTDAAFKMLTVLACLAAIEFPASRVFAETVQKTAAPAAPALSDKPSEAVEPPETKEHRDARMKWWREARFGMFIHWGVYSVPAGRWNGKPVWGGGEWIMNCGEIPVADYKKLPAQFNPVKFDANEWVRIAKEAGIKYMVITAKHHDGFAMFKTEDPFNIVDATPFKRDVLKELAEACRQQDMKLGFYYSQAQDWTHPGGAAYKINKRTTPHWDTAQDGDMDEYLKTIAAPQVKELLTEYGPVAAFWWDTPLQMTKERVDLLQPLLKLQPDVIVNSRLGTGGKGDVANFEQKIPETPQGRDWETCMTMNDTWSYKADDDKWKPSGALIWNLIDVASKGGNYLLNVGPTGEGAIPEPSVKRLKEIGAWLKVNGEAIYGTSQTPFGPEAGSFSPVEKDKKGKPVFHSTWEWRCTAKPGLLYLHLLQWPGGSFSLSGVKGAVSKAYLLADPERKALALSQKGDKVAVALPKTAPDPVASVLCLEIRSK